MPYPDTRRVVYAGPQLDEDVLPSVMYLMHTTNEPNHTLKNGLIIPQENTGWRTKDSGQARGRRSSTIRLQAYIRLQEVGVWLESLIGAPISVGHPANKVQVITLTGTPAGGTFKLQYGPHATGITGTIAFDATAPTVQAALVALPNLGVGDVTVAGSAGGPWTATFPNLSSGAPNNLDGPFILKKTAVALTGGTSPNVSITSAVISGAYQHKFVGGLLHGIPLAIQFFNGLYWRQILGMRVNTCNIQGMGNGLAMLDIELIGQASTKISTPTALVEDIDYPQVDAPMQYVQVDGLIDADMDRFALNVNNNLTQRSPMDRSTSAGRTRFGDFSVDIDAMADYPDYTGSLYERFELNTRITGGVDLWMVDDQLLVGTVTPIHPYMGSRLPLPVLADMTEGSDGGELVQMIKGKGQPSTAEGGTLIVLLGNDKPGSYYDPT